MFDCWFVCLVGRGFLIDFISFCLSFFRYLFSVFLLSFIHSVQFSSVRFSSVQDYFSSVQSGQEQTNKQTYCTDSPGHTEISFIQFSSEGRKDDDFRSGRTDISGQRDNDFRTQMSGRRFQDR